MPYQFLEDITLADYAFEAWGQTPEEMCLAAAQALTSLMTDTAKALKTSITRKVSIRSMKTSPVEAIEELLFQFLEKILILKDSENSIVHAENIRITVGSDGAELSCEFLYSPISQHELGIDVKAITHHRFQVKKENNSWTATIVVDV